LQFLIIRPASIARLKYLDRLLVTLFPAKVISHCKIKPLLAGEALQACCRNPEQVVASPLRLIDATQRKIGTDLARAADDAFLQKRHGHDDVLQLRRLEPAPARVRGKRALSR